MADRYRVGHRCPHNIYLGDDPVGHGQTGGGFTSEANAARLVADANAGLNIEPRGFCQVIRYLRDGYRPERTGDEWVWWRRDNRGSLPMTSEQRSALDQAEEGYDGE